MQLNWLILLLFTVKIAELRPLPSQESIISPEDVGAEVLVPPVKYVTLGSSVTLDCHALLYKTPLSGLEWREGAVAVRSREGRVHISGPELPKLRLTINNFRLSDVGDYTCTLRTAWNQTASATTTVTLKGQEGFTVFEYFKLSHNASHATACKGSGIIYRKQLLHGTITMVTSPNVAVTQLTKLSDQSKVMCLTDTGVIQRVEYVLADYEPITFLQPVVNDTMLPYQNRYSIPCTVMGHPQPELSWLSFDDIENTQTELTNSPGIEVVKGEANLTLTIPWYIGFFRSGRYACRASNTWETSTQVIHLPLEEDQQPLIEWFGIETFEAPSEVKAGETLRVNCSAWADSFLGVYGYVQNLNATSQADDRVERSEEVVDPSHKRFSLTVYNTSEADAGMYQCAVFSVKLFRTLWSEPIQVSIV